MSLAGKVAFVTGGSRGLGAGISEVLAERGASTVITDILPTEELASQLSKKGYAAVGKKTDVTDFENVQSSIQKTVEEFGRIDILVNNAGVNRIGFIEEVPLEDWNFIFDINAKGVFHACRSAVPHMKRQGGGKIVNISSASGRRGHPRHTIYCASKFAVIGLTQALALDLAPFNINVNSVCPGPMYTPMWRDYLEVEWSRIGQRPREGIFEESVKREVPLGKPTEVRDVANAVAFLASDEASNITGAALDVSGGHVMR